MPLSVSAAEPGARASLAALAVANAGIDAQVAEVYRQRGYRPIWAKGHHLRPEAKDLIVIVARADRQGLDPETYHPGQLAALSTAADAGAAAALAQADLALSQAFAAYAADLRRASPGAAMAFIDPGLPSPPTPRSALEALAQARSLANGLAAAQRMNPIYEALRRDLAAAPERDKPLLRANLERARALPPSLGKRYIIVDVATATLGLYEEGRLVDSMRVGVGKASDQTPAMAGLVRYAIFNPYWNVPEDLVRERIAPNVLREGLDYIAVKNFEALADWSPNARVLDPQTLDWKAIAEGRKTVRMRQRPGAGNMMGAVKFMLPNALGIYLHDTPDKALLAGQARTISAGCVRLADAQGLGRWLLGPRASGAGRAPDKRVDLGQPAPVYIVYFTAWPGEHGPEKRPDVYRRDPALIAALQTRQGRPDLQASL